MHFQNKKIVLVNYLKLLTTIIPVTVIFLCMSHKVFAQSALTYCDSQGGGNFEWIANVSIGGFSHSSNGLAAYTDFTHITANLTTGDQVAAFTPGFSSTPFIQFWSVWIDFNENGVFDFDEKLLDNESSASTVNATLIIPVSASGVTTRMRVTMSYHAPAAGPCGSIGIGQGEVEDYTVSIVSNGENIPPTANANGPYAGDINTTIDFSSNGSNDPDGSITSYRWDFGDGESSTQANPSHTYTAAGAYDVTLTVVDNVGASNVTTTTATISGASPAYCASVGGNTFEWIANVSVGELNSSSGGASEYTDFTNLIANLTIGDNAASFTPGFSGSAFNEFWSVWIDFNNDNDFTDVGEQLVSGQSGTSTVNATLAIPASAAGITTRMRVSMKYNAVTNEPCGDIGDGEVEDYTVLIMGSSQ